jgi:hypothetical protein
MCFPLQSSNATPQQGSQEMQPSTRKKCSAPGNQTRPPSSWLRRAALLTIHHHQGAQRLLYYHGNFHMSSLIELAPIMTPVEQEDQQQQHATGCVFIKKKQTADLLRSQE